MAPIDVDRESSARRADAPSHYRAYLNSSHWLMVRNAALKRANYRCHKCGSKRDPNVHHKSYERLGNERDEDIEVLCFTCHNGLHLEQAQEEPVGVYVKIVSDVLACNPVAQIADISDETKRFCLAHKIPVKVALIDKAISLVCGTRMKDGKQPYQSVVDVPQDKWVPDLPLTAAQAVEMLARLRVMAGVLGVTTPLVKPMPKAKLVTRHTADSIRAFEMVKQEMEASIARCEALESEEV